MLLAADLSRLPLILERAVAQLIMYMMLTSSSKVLNSNGPLALCTYPSHIIWRGP